MPPRSKVHLLPPEVKAWLDQALVENKFSDYELLEKELSDRGYQIGKSSINRYGQEFEEKLAAIRIATEQARAITEAIPDDAGAMTYAVAAHERLLQAKESVPGLKKLWRRSGKIHSRLHHDAADGQIQDVDKPFVIHAKTGPVKMMHPHDPKAPAGEVINCGCISLPHMASWDMATPGKKPFSDLELANSPIKRALSEAQPVNKPAQVKHSSKNLAAFARLVEGSKLFGADFVGPIMEKTGASAPEAAALADYLHDGYRDVNQALRGIAPSPRMTAKELDGYVEAMSGMIDKLPRPYEPVLMRVLGDMNDETRAKVLDAYQHIGQEVRYNEFLSTSAPGGEFTALNRSQVELKIKPAQGSRRAGVVGDLSPYHHEKEVLYKAGSRFRVLDIRPLAGDRIRIVLEEIE